MIVLANAIQLPIATNSVQLILTDPPYAIMNKQDLTRGGAKPIRRTVAFDKLSAVEYEQLIKDFLVEALRVLVDNGTLIMFCADRFLSDIIRWGEQVGLHYRMLYVWYKTNPAPKIYRTSPQAAAELATLFTVSTGTNVVLNGNLGKMHNVITSPIVHHSRRIHETQKPLSVLSVMIERHSNPGDTVLDPFCGSGSTVKAAIALQRQGIGLDIDKTYLDKAQNFVYNIQYQLF